MSFSVSLAVLAHAQHVAWYGAREVLGDPKTCFELPLGRSVPRSRAGGTRGFLSKAPKCHPRSPLQQAGEPRCSA